MRTKTKFLPLMAVFCWASSAAAHDLWIQPQKFWTTINAPIPFTIQVGHGPDRQRWSVDTDRILSFRIIGPNGTTERKQELRFDDPTHDAVLPFTAPGTYIVALETSHAESGLPALRFNDYLKEEGLTPALEHRQKAKTMNKAGREFYSRRGKAIVHVPGENSANVYVTKALGLTLELIPERNPYDLKAGEPLPVRVMYEGRPLTGALVKLTNLDFDAKPLETKISDQDGRAMFSVPQNGSWLVNVIWTKPLEGNAQADFETVFSSLTFGYPRGQVR